jgi:hypothetical protein
MSDRTALAQLATCLRGDLPVAPDWMALLVLANQALVTPRLCREMTRSGAIDRVPEDVRKFLLAVSQRNRERNRRLSVQLHDTLGALNDAGIEPVLLKGAALWASSRTDDQFDRVMRDIDLMVQPSESERAIEALEKIGLRCLVKYPEDLEHMHAVAELGRPSDVGATDLHCRPPGPQNLAEIIDLDAHCTRVSLFGGNAKVPAPALQIFFLVLHDQFHDGNYWRGALDLRHLLDIQQLSAACHASDWSLIEQLCRTRLVRHALEVQLIAAERLVAAPVPANLTQRRWTRIHYRRHLAQFAHPRLRLPLAVIALLSETPNLPAYWSFNERRGPAEKNSPKGLPRLMHRARRLKDILFSRG